MNEVENLGRHVAHGTTQYSYSRDKVEKIAQCLKDNNFTVSSCFHVLDLGSEIQNSVAEEIEFVERIIPLAKSFEVIKIWDAIELQHFGRGIINKL